MIRFNMNAYYLLIGLFCLCYQPISAQDQRVADSLALIYNRNEVVGIEKLELLRDLSFNEKSDPDLAMEYAEELIRLSELQNEQNFLFSGYLQKGFKHNFKGDSNEALSSFLKCVDIAQELGDISLEGSAYMAIADVYSLMQNEENGEIYYSRSIDLLRKSNDSIGLASALVNAGDFYFNIKKYDEALNYFKESGEIFEQMDSEIGTAYNLGNVGMVYAEQGKDDLAQQNIERAIGILEKAKDFYPISVYLKYMSEIYLNKNEWDVAYSYAERSLELAKKYNLKEPIRDANLQLAELNEIKDRFRDSNFYLKEYYVYRDSILNLETIEEMADLRTDFEVSQKQIEVDLLDEQKKNQQLISLLIGIGLLLILIISVGLFRRNKFIQRAKALIENEKKRSDLLLLNILPEETASELKDNGKVKAKRFESVTVMFTDFKGFTAYSDKLSPEELVDSIDYYYSRFDEIIDSHGLEKIKTVGDAYMCAGGLPDPNPDHALKMVAAAFEIAEFVKEAKKNDPDDMTRFDIRIGINTGPVVAGVVGKKKFAYDIWGDTVNIASRMESNSEPGKINISEATFQLIRDKYICIYRGEVEAKNKGMMKMYFVDGLH